MKKKLCLLLAMVMALASLCSAAAEEAAGTRPLAYDELPASHRARFDAEMNSALANARNRAPGRSLLVAAARGENSGYSATKTDQSLTASYTVSDSMVEVGEKVKFHMALSCEATPMIYTVGGLLMDTNFDKVGELVKNNGESVEVHETTYSYSFSFTPEQAGYLNFVVIVTDSEGNCVSLTTPTVQIYEGDVPLFDSIGSDKDIGMDINNNLAMRLSLDSTSLKIGEILTATATLTTARDPVTYNITWTLTDSAGNVLDKQESTGTTNAQASISTLRFSYQPLQVGAVQFLITATDGDGNAVRINTPDIPVEDRFFFQASLDKDALSVGDSATGMYRIHGHSCPTTVAFVGWECYDAFDTDKVLAYKSTVVDGRAGQNTFTPRVGETIVFYVGATCEHFTDAYPATDRLTLIGGTQVELATTAESAYSGSSIGVEYIVDGGLTPYQDIIVTGYSYDSAAGKTYTFLGQDVSQEEGTVSGVPYWGDQVYFVIKVVEADGHTSTWKSPTIPMTRIPGDANYSGTVDLEDALLVLRYATDNDITINVGCADVNGDTKADIHDALLLFQYAAGWDVTLK